jgi:scyllo-inositol 2-dehydrogenase (NADP+)
MQHIKTAIIGFGLSGKVFHARVLRAIPQFVITSVVSSRVDEVREELPEAQVVASTSEVFADESVDLVIIATPTGAHAQLAQQALEAGKHVVVEKPFAVSSREARGVVEYAERAGKVLSVFHNRRWDNGFLTLKRELQTGSLGAVYQYEARFDRFRPQVNPGRWREQAVDGAGILYDLGSHLIDQSLHLFGRPASVYCDLHAQREQAAADDYFVILFDYGSLQVTLRAGSVVGVPGPVLQAHGAKGSFIKRALDPQEDALRAGKCPTTLGDTWGLDADGGEIHQLDAAGNLKLVTCRTEPGDYCAYYRGIFKSIVEGASAPVSARDGLAVIELIEACMLSAREGCIVRVSS